MKRRTTLVICLAMLVILAISAVLLIPFIKKQLYPRDYEEYVAEYAKEYSVPEPLVYAVIHTESGFDTNAVSSAGAKGLMQLIPETMEWVATDLLDEKQPTGDIHDPEVNIKYGTRYLRFLYDLFGTWETAIAAYNAGQGRVDSWLDDTRYSEDGNTLKEIPIEETKNYVNKVSDAWKLYEELYYGD